MLSCMRTQPPSAGEMPEQTSEAEAKLVAQARVDRAAFAPLYARYLEPVYRYCYLRLGRQETVEDATSEVFYKALANLSKCRAVALAAGGRQQPG